MFFENCVVQNRGKRRRKSTQKERILQLDYDTINEKNIQVFCNYPIIYEDEYIIELINDDKKLVIEFYEDKVKYTILEIDKYEFDINEAKWKEINNINFENDEQIIRFIVEKYREIM